MPKKYSSLYTNKYKSNISILAHGSHFKLEDCNFCTCFHGRVKCTNLTCGTVNGSSCKYNLLENRSRLYCGNFPIWTPLGLKSECPD